MIRKGFRLDIREEGAVLGYARVLDVVGGALTVSFAGALATLTCTARELLTANRTYYVRTDGSDSNTGLANSSGGAFATIQKAVNVLAALDLSTFTATIQLGNTGNYAGFSVTAPFVGGPGSAVTLIGDTSAPGSYVLTSSVTILNSARFYFSGVDFTPSSGDGLSLSGYAYAQIAGACHFGVTTGARQILLAATSTLLIGAVCTQNGGAANWILAAENSIVSSNALVHVWSGTPAYSSATVVAQTGAAVSIVNGTPSGAATGTRYSATLNGVIFTNGGGANFFPGNAAGSTATGGQYA